MGGALEGSAGLDTMQTLRIKTGCADLIARYALAVNRWDLDEFVALWTPDAVWQRPGNPPLEGYDAIRGFMAAQPVDRVLRHVNGASVITVVDEHDARAWSQTTVYDSAGKWSLPAPLSGPDMVVEYEDRIVVDGERFRFARRDTTVVLSTPQSARAN
ncbi:MAG TPA: nuclear transport factor 2 family protein [Amycolatopsis sp.]|nr:nuclear transport factor 2 family protein [Amycolatopsis sp.]